MLKNEIERISLILLNLKEESQFIFCDFQFFMNLVAPHLNVTERVPAIDQLDDDEQMSSDSVQVNHFDPSILKTTFKNSKSKKKSAI